MTKYREILRLKSLGFSERNIAQSCGVSRNTVAKVLKKAAEIKLSWPLDFDIVIGIVAQTTRSCQFELTDHKICYKVTDCKKYYHTDHKVDDIAAQTGLKRHRNSGDEFQIAEGM